MQDNEVINILLNQLSFSPKNISDLKIFKNELLKANTKHNFISKNTETVIWHRHILDSAQLVKFIDFSKGSLSDLGSGAGFPGLILALFNKNKKLVGVNTFTAEGENLNFAISVNDMIEFLKKPEKKIIKKPYIEKKKKGPTWITKKDKNVKKNNIDIKYPNAEKGDMNENGKTDQPTSVLLLCLC